MKAKEALEQIKSLLFADEAGNAPEVVTEFAEGVLTDGTIVKFDKLEVGGIISVVTEEGEVPAPVGEHELEDGTVVIVTEPGVIAEIKMAEGEEVEVEIEAEQKKEEEAFDYDAKFLEISETFNSKMTEIESKVSALNDVTKKLIEFMEAFATIESAPESQAPKNTFLAQNKNVKEDAYKKLQNIFQTIKK
jgi:predicted DNA-binding antitoxin AbrB/MazE fold protein